MRTSWMLSSIMQQNIWPFKITVDIACMENNGNPSTEKIASAFSYLGLYTKLTVVKNKNRFARRGFVRNIQVKNAIKSGAKYIFFADADNVYHPDFFKLLIDKLSELGDCGKVIYSPYKIHTQMLDTNKTIADCMVEYPFIKDAYKRAKELPVFEIPKHLLKNGAAAGCMQVVSINDMISKCGGVYSDKLINDRDLFRNGQLARSDRKFRERMGGSLKIRLPEYIHLGHIRDKELGYHTEEQR